MEAASFLGPRTGIGTMSLPLYFFWSESIKKVNPDPRRWGIDPTSSWEKWHLYAKWEEIAEVISVGRVPQS